MKFLIFLFFVSLSISLIFCKSTNYSISNQLYLPDTNQIKVSTFINKHRKEARDWYSFRALLHTAEKNYSVEGEGISVSQKILFKGFDKGKR